MDGSKLTTGDYLVGGGGLIFLVAMVLPWFGQAGYSENGLDFFLTGIVPLLLLVVVITIVVLREHTELDLPDVPVPWVLVELVVAGAALLLVLLRLLLGSSFTMAGSTGGATEVDLSTRYGIFIALLAVLVVIGGLVLKVLEEGGFAELRPGGGGDPFPPNPEGL